MTSSWPRVVPACIVAIVLRLVLIRYTPVQGINEGDLNVYHTTAVNLANDSAAWFRPGSEFGYRAPLYFAYLSAIYKVSGHHTYHVGQIANLMLVAVILFLLYRVTEAWFGIRVATIAVWLRAVLPSFVVTDLFVMSEQLFNGILLTILAVMLTNRHKAYRLRSVLTLGFLAGAALLTREFAKGLVIVLLGVIILESYDVKTKFFRVSMTVLGLAIILSPWMWRNTLVWGSPTPLSLTTGVNLHIGNHPNATGKWMEITDIDHVSPSHVKFGTPEADRWHWDRAIQYIRDAPGRFIVMGVRKIGYLVWPQSLRTELLYANFFPQFPWIFRMLLVVGSAAACAAVWLLGLIGLTARPLDRYSWAVIVILAYTCAVVFVAYGSPRYADPVVLLLLAPASYVLCEFKSVVCRLQHPSLQSVTAWGAVTTLGILWTVILAEKLL